VLFAGPAPECAWASGPPIEVKVSVILSEAKDHRSCSELQRFFASLRMTVALDGAEFISEMGAAVEEADQLSH
jgi:hypothetical protein